MKKLFLVSIVLCMMLSLFGCGPTTKTYTSGKTEGEVLDDYVSYVNSKKCYICKWSFKGEGLVCGMCRSKYPEIAAQFDDLLK